MNELLAMYKPNQCPKCGRLGDKGLRVDGKKGRFPKCLCSFCGCVWFRYEAPIASPYHSGFPCVLITIADGTIVGMKCDIKLEGELAGVVDEWARRVLEREWGDEA